MKELIKNMTDWLSSKEKKRKIIKPNDLLELKNIIKQEMAQYGNECDLNHIDVSHFVSLRDLFQHLEFNGDISRWNVSNVIDMRGTFAHSYFNGDLSKWDVSNVIEANHMFAISNFNQDISMWNTSKIEMMFGMFQHSKFNQDISSWDVSKVKLMGWMFLDSAFSYNLDNWTPLNIEDVTRMFDECKCPRPFWYDDNPKNIIYNLTRYPEMEQLNNDLITNLPMNEMKEKKRKI